MVEIKLKMRICTQYDVGGEQIGTFPENLTCVFIAVEGLHFFHVQMTCALQNRMLVVYLIS